ncbi:hypothetical protein AMTR_s00009p00228940 [Amborella trichopoda]|uniref:Uncharacterized protein n=1 Tax=Amborella trichopoda TaxID=13333 RepID=W1NGR1_AMBTC|nr:hypothetical protein AMTR_s00009p00228940 [Amborella trichopoda]
MSYVGESVPRLGGHDQLWWPPSLRDHPIYHFPWGVTLSQELPFIYMGYGQGSKLCSN